MKEFIIYQCKNNRLNYFMTLKAKNHDAVRRHIIDNRYRGAFYFAPSKDWKKVEGALNV